MKKILLSGGKAYALVDDEDFKFLNQFKWSVDKDGYAFTMIKMHRYLAKPAARQLVDHINQNKADNRRNNLRLATPAQNSWHRNYPKKPNAHSKYRGVSKASRGKGWMAYIKAGDEPVQRIGRFHDERHAALAYDFWATLMHGDYAITNFKVVSTTEKPMGGNYGQMGKSADTTTS